jgi:hypothetical protein
MGIAEAALPGVRSRWPSESAARQTSPVFADARIRGHALRVEVARREHQVLVLNVAKLRNQGVRGGGPARPCDRVAAWGRQRGQIRRNIDRSAIVPHKEKRRLLLVIHEQERLGGEPRLPPSRPSDTVLTDGCQKRILFAEARWIKR